ncbi:MAG: hypothetical protein JWL61_2916 [Gemmatimonadetes bacterium]|nr:hypothetical protein [Gemmatimonadota bacterium]
MRSKHLLVAAAVIAAITACSSGGGVSVRTTVEPGANLSGLHSFYVLTPPTRATNATPLATNDPMLENSITNRALRTDLTQAFQGRGYTPAPQRSADFVVAYYAGTKEKFDTTYWGPTYDPAWRYSYRGRRGWAWPYYGAGYSGGPFYQGATASVNTYTQGQVIVDVTDPRTNELLWRGQGVEPVSTDPTTYTNQLQGVVTAIVAKFPQPSPATVASGP